MTYYLLGFWPSPPVYYYNFDQTLDQERRKSKHLLGRSVDMHSPHQKSGATTPERAQSNQRHPQVRERYVNTITNNNHTQRRRKAQAAVTGVGIPKV